MDELKVLKAISNETRLQILKWLKDPTENFEPQSHSLSTNNFLGGVCVASIKKGRFVPIYCIYLPFIIT